MRVLIIGAAGLLGHTLFRRWPVRSGWKAAGADVWTPVRGVRRLDVLDPGAVRTMLKETRPEAVVFTASNPHVDFCETDPEECRKLNVDAALAAARASIDTGARFVFFSSDYVFDGEKGSYSEADEPAPLNEYGRQKLEVEEALAKEGERVLVLRMSALFGWELKPRNFVLQVLGRLHEGRPVRAAKDQDYAPTYAESVAEALAVLLEKRESGLLHLAGPDRLTRMELAAAAAESFGLDKSRIEGVPLADLQQPDRARRPRRSFLDSSKAAGILGVPLTGVREALKDMAARREEWEAYINSERREGI